MKRILSTLLLCALTVSLLCITALAEGEQRSLDAGFYSVGTAANVTIEPRTAANVKVDATSATVGEGVAKYYEGAERLSVTYTGAAEEGEQFLVLLVTGKGLPTAADTICYIDQTAKDAGSVTFDVYPMLPRTGGDLTLYITSNRENFTTIEVPMKYALANTYTEAPYTKGDVNDSGGIDAIDALLALQHSAELTTLTGNNFLAADVNSSGAIDAIDALKILQYAAELIESFD